jgi:hypothetical protein
MTSKYERRIRHLEGRNTLTGANAVVIGRGAPEPTPEDLSQAALVLRVAFVSAKDGRLTDGENHAQH